MANAILSHIHFHNEAAAFAYVEADMWPNGPVCPHCNATAERIGRINARTKPSQKNPEGVERHGLRKCYACRKTFTVRVGTIFEDSHLPLHMWLQAIHLLNSSKKGISTRQIQRLLQCSMKTAWFLTHRVREIMKPSSTEPMGGAGTMVEVDETYIGRKHGVPVRRGHHHKHTVLTLVERGATARSFHIDKASAREIVPILNAHVDKDTILMSDEGTQYITPGKSFAEHHVVNHGNDEYVRGDAHTNTVEGFYSVFKRGMVGVYQHCSEKHLHRYLVEFDFRYSNRAKLGVDDKQRAGIALRNSKGRRLTYRRTSGNNEAASLG